MIQQIITQLIGGAITVIGLLVVYFFTHRKLQEIHVLVNSRLQAALEELRLLKEELAKHE